MWAAHDIFIHENVCKRGDDMSIVDAVHAVQSGPQDFTEPNEFPILYAAAREVIRGSDIPHDSMLQDWRALSELRFRTPSLRNRFFESFNQVVNGEILNILQGSEHAMPHSIPYEIMERGVQVFYFHTDHDSNGHNYHASDLRGPFIASETMQRFSANPTVPTSVSPRLTQILSEFAIPHGNRSVNRNDFNRLLDHPEMDAWLRRSSRSISLEQSILYRSLSHIRFENPTIRKEFFVELTARLGRYRRESLWHAIGILERDDASNYINRLHVYRRPLARNALEAWNRDHGETNEAILGSRNCPDRSIVESVADDMGRALFAPFLILGNTLHQTAGAPFTLLASMSGQRERRGLFELGSFLPFLRRYLGQPANYSITREGIRFRLQATVRIQTPASLISWDAIEAELFRRDCQVR